MLQKSSLELRLLYVGELIKIRLLYKFYMLRFYKLITTIKISLYCNKACESKMNLKPNIFCKHMAILRFLRLQQHHAKLVEPYFTFLHTYIIYKSFTKP